MLTLELAEAGRVGAKPFLLADLAKGVVAPTAVGEEQFLTSWTRS